MDFIHPSIIQISFTAFTQLSNRKFRATQSPHIRISLVNFTIFPINSFRHRCAPISPLIFHLFLIDFIQRNSLHPGYVHISLATFTPLANRLGSGQFTAPTPLSTILVLTLSLDSRQWPALRFLKSPVKLCVGNHQSIVMYLYVYSYITVRK